MCGCFVCLWTWTCVEVTACRFLSGMLRLACPIYRGLAFGASCGAGGDDRRCCRVEKLTAALTVYHSVRVCAVLISNGEALSLRMSYWMASVSGTVASLHDRPSSVSNLKR